MTLSPDRPTMPPLNALRAFEAAARLGGFAVAAEELCVTAGAISQHIKTLESWAGAPLFERRSQGVQLTSLGQQIAGDFRTAFDQIGDAVLKLKSTATPDIIQIAALPSVAQLWLSPRLPKIREALPGAVISISAVERAPNFRRAPFDISIFFDEYVKQQGTDKLCDDLLFPVCSPQLASQITKPEDLVNTALLHDASWPKDWDNWLALAAPTLNLNTSGPVFSLYSLAVDEAKNGAGVLIGHAPLVSRYLATGELVQPFETVLKSRQQLTVSSTTRDGAVGKVVKALKRSV